MCDLCLVKTSWFLVEFFVLKLSVRPRVKAFSLLLFFSLCSADCYDGVNDDDDDDDDVGLVNTSPSSKVPAAAAAAVRRTSLQCPTSCSASRSKPPPPVRRTSSVTGTSPMLRSPTSDGGDDRWPGELLSAAAARPGGVPSPSRARAIVDGRPSSPRRAASSVRVSSAPRRSLSSAYADLCQTLNDQLAAGGGAAARRPGGWRSSAVDAPTSPDAATVRRQLSVDVGPRSTADSLLMDIKRGVCLRPTVSNDRSAPSIHRT